MSFNLKSKILLTVLLMASPMVFAGELDAPSSDHSNEVVVSDTVDGKVVLYKTPGLSKLEIASQLEAAQSEQEKEELLNRLVEQYGIEANRIGEIPKPNEEELESEATCHRYYRRGGYGFGYCYQPRRYYAPTRVTYCTTTYRVRYYARVSSCRQPVYARSYSRCGVGYRSLYW